jgi:DNA anti-recombination protein RmuC
MRSTWTDERMDDLNHRVDDVGRRMDNRFDHVEARIDSMGDRLDARIDSMQRAMIQVGGGMIATLIAGFAALIATRL